MLINIYIPKLTERSKYTFRWIMDQIFSQINICFIQEIESFRRVGGPKLNYGNVGSGGREIFIPNTGLLSEEGIRPQQIEVRRDRDLHYFFAAASVQADLSFDLPAMIFYLLSRYEEYLPFRADQYGRFPASESLAFREGFLQQAIIDQWLWRLKRLFRERWNALPFREQSYQFQPTIDVDMAWAYRHKGWWRSLGATVRDLSQARLTLLKQRIAVLLGSQPDPYFLFSYLEQLHRSLRPAPIYFFLLGDYGPFDKNIDHRNPQFRALIATVSRNNTVGLHPSYRSNSIPARLKEEKRRLEELTGQLITKSRQHFLRLHLPFTYRNLIATGIHSDYTMGYAGHPGFRAGVARPFPWYDLQKEQATELMIYPFQLMDVTLKQYLGLSPEEAKQRISSLIDHIRSVDGTFTSIWHNSSFAAAEYWEGWKAVYEHLLEQAA